MDFKINPDKIKSLDYLLNRVFEKDHAHKPKFCFLLGAGCSIYSGIPSGWGVVERCRTISFLNNHSKGFKIKKDQYSNWNEFYQQAEKFRDEKKDEFEQFIKETEIKFRRKLDENRIREIIPDEIEERDDFDFNEFAEKVFNDSLYGYWLDEYDQDPKERQMFIEHMIENAEPAGDYILLASLISDGVIHNVFTTNFDDLVNEALVNYYSVRARVYAHNEMARFITHVSKRPNIIKLHGDYLYENIKNTTRETGDLEANMKTKFSEMLNTLNLVVIGYGGADHSVMKVLELAKNNHKYCLLWCSNDIDKINWRVVHLLNSTDNSFFVDVSDFQTLVMKLWTNAELKLPDLDIDTRQKKTKLSDFMGSYSKQVKDKKEVTAKEMDILEDKTEAYDWFNKAYDEKDPKKQIEFYSKAISFDPNYSVAYNNRGVAYNKLSDFKSAIDDYTKAIELDPQYILALNNRGLAYTNLAQYNNAINNFDIIINLDPQDTNAIYNRGWTNNELGKYNEAIEDFNRLLKLDPKFINAYLTRGWSMTKLGNYIDAYKDFEKVIKLDPKNAEAYYFMGWSKNEQGNQEEAIKDLSKAIELDPNYSIAYNNRSVAYIRLKEYDLAQEDINKAIELDPENSLNYFNKGCIFNDQNEYKLAIEEFNKAEKKDPLYINTYYNRGWSNNKLGNFEMAIDDFDKVLKMDSKFSDALINRAWAKTRLKDYNGALADYQGAIKLNSEDISINLSLSELYVLLNKLPDAEKTIDATLKITDNKSDQAFLYYLQSIALTMQNKNAAPYEKKLDNLLKMNIQISWDLIDIEEWIKQTKLPDEKSKYIQNLTKKIKANIN